MNSKDSKINLISATALVISSQVGVGVLTVTSTLSLMGPTSLIGWLISGICAILLAIVFSKLCKDISEEGGIISYVEEAFGSNVSFFIGWSYWVVYSISDVAVTITAAACFCSYIELNSYSLFYFGAFILFIITLVNLCGVVFSTYVELLLTILKCAFLIGIPLGGFTLFNIDNLKNFIPNEKSTLEIMFDSAYVTFWCFIGLESATVVTRFMDQYRTASKAVILGTIIALAVYMLSSIGIMLTVPISILATSASPYIETAKVIWGEKFSIIISVFSFIICIGTLNAGILAGGQIGYIAAKKGIFPVCFIKNNKYGAPYISLVFSLLLMIVLLAMTIDSQLSIYLNHIINISVTNYLFIYVACLFAFLKLSSKKKKFLNYLTLIPLGACLIMLLSNSFKNIMLGLLPIVSGLPIYIWRRSKSSKTIIEDLQEEGTI